VTIQYTIQNTIQYTIQHHHYYSRKCAICIRCVSSTRLTYIHTSYIIHHTSYIIHHTSYFTLHKTCNTRQDVNTARQNEPLWSSDPHDSALAFFACLLKLRSAEQTKKTTTNFLHLSVYLMAISALLYCISIECVCIYIHILCNERNIRWC